MINYLNEFMVIYGIFLLGAISPGPDFIMIVRNSTGMVVRLDLKLHLVYVLVV